MKQYDKDILQLISKLPDAKLSKDFNEQVFRKIAELEGKKSNRKITERSNHESKLKKISGKFAEPFIRYSVAAVLAVFTIYYFVFREMNQADISDTAGREKQVFEYNPFSRNNEKFPSVFSESDFKKLDSIINSEKIKLELTTKSIEKTVRSLAEDNSKNINKLFAGINKTDTSGRKTLTYHKYTQAGIGAGVDSVMEKKIEMMNRYLMKVLGKEDVILPDIYR